MEKTKVAHKKIGIVCKGCKSDLAHLQNYVTVFIMSDLLITDFDLTLKKGTNDFSEEFDNKEVITQQIITAFDMKPADDIDYPEFFSKQRASINSENPVDVQHRIQDAYRIIEQFPQIDQQSVEVDFISERLSVNFQLKEGTKISLRV
ncbi:MAG: hypothetical protein AAF518_17525 [Spirochaetota bacterium]